MKNNYTFDDIPMILNSISWQLKRIADSLERDDLEDEPIEKSKSSNEAIPKIRRLLDELNPRND